MKINIVPYNDEWPLLFETIKKEIKKSIIDNKVIIEHIGSTSVNNLASKPIKITQVKILTHLTLFLQAFIQARIRKNRTLATRTPLNI